MQQEAGTPYVAFESVTDDDLADTVGGEAVARMHALAAGPLDAWLSRIEMADDAAIIVDDLIELDVVGVDHASALVDRMIDPVRVLVERGDPVVAWTHAGTGAPLYCW